MAHREAHWRDVPATAISMAGSLRRQFHRRLAVFFGLPVVNRAPPCNCSIAPRDRSVKTVTSVTVDTGTSPGRGAENVVALIKNARRTALVPEGTWRVFVSLAACCFHPT